MQKIKNKIKQPQALLAVGCYGGCLFSHLVCFLLRLLPSKGRQRSHIYGAGLMFFVSGAETKTS